MSIGQSLALSQMAELAGDVTEEQLEAWVKEGLIPVQIPEPGPWSQDPRIDVNQVFAVRALRDGKTPEQARSEVLKNGRAGDTWSHTPPTQDEQERLRERIASDRQKLFQQIRRPS